MKRIPRAAAIVLLLVGGALAVAASMVSGSTSFSALTADIVRYRLGRGVLAFSVGAALGASGVVFQGLFRNGLADPFVVGVSGGAALGAVVSAVFGLGFSIIALASSTVTAFVGGLGAAFLAYGLARVRGRVSVAGLLLAGSALSSFFGAIVSILLLYGNQNWSEIISWLMGNLGRPDPWDRALVLAPCLVASVAVMALHARDLNLLLLGEEQARQLGVDAERTKIALLGAGALAASAAVATCGMIGFVGLIVPHVARRLVGPDHRTLLPVALLAGGALLALADAVARVISTQMPLPIGAVTALAGAPFFVYILRRRSAKM
ncbi:MAG: iron chelate uptake ABC transporter family permease subunit [Planctomycetaceae bacterium]|nr:iron chelate uptake ABC transporter family permease subunit [Planctomycetaceae bacterium]